MARLKIISPVVFAELMLQISMEVIALHDKSGYREESLSTQDQPLKLTEKEPTAGSN
jgi:hypothetical protein